MLGKKNRKLGPRYRNEDEEDRNRSNFSRISNILPSSRGSQWPSEYGDDDDSSNPSNLPPPPNPGPNPNPGPGPDPANPPGNPPDPAGEKAFSD